MNFSEQPPSKQWTALRYRGERVAEVWFKPEEEPAALKIRIPRSSFQIPGIGQRLTPELLLKAVGISPQEVDTWRHESTPDSVTNGSDSELGHLFSPPAPDVAHLNLYFILNPQPPVFAPSENNEPETPEAIWQHLEARWEAILSVEASVDSLRLSMEGLRAEMEAATGKALHVEEKVHASSADVALWNRAKNRIRYALPKLRECIHRSTWSKGAAERKMAEEYLTNHVRPRIHSPHLDQILAQYDSLLKNRQVLSAQGASVHQECKRILAETEAALRTLQRNSAANASKKRGATKRKR
ncbi:MAG TPA: hypothetical protein VG122_15395 [Gemmata sp.]|jgi:hypothetical protein|nr:hypothetical protein [Gemmata sp.]